MRFEQENPTETAPHLTPTTSATARAWSSGLPEGIGHCPVVMWLDVHVVMGHGNGHAQGETMTET